MIKRFGSFMASHREALLLLYWIPHFIWYELVVHFTPMMNYHIIHSPLDDAIPFSEIFIIPYSMWFFYIAAVQLYFLIKDRTDFINVTKLLYISLISSMLVCTFYPSTHTLRPDVFPRDNLLTDAVKFLDSIDTPDMPAGILPSMHALVSLVLAAAVLKSRCLRGKPVIKTAACVLSALICASTVLIKQHSVIDVYLAVAFFVPIYIVVYHIWKTKPPADMPAEYF